MDKQLKTPPPYLIASVDHALRAAAILQMEGGATVSQLAERLGVARSTAHRILAMLVYRDFAVQGEDRVYRAGPVLELAAHSQSLVSRLRAAALPHLRRVVDLLDETTNLIVRTGDTARFIASVECRRALRVGSREGMVFPAHRVTAGLLLLADLSDEELDEVYAPERYRDRPGERPDPARLRTELARLRRNGFAVNQERSERGLVAVGVPVRDRDGTAVAGLSVSMPGVRYDPHRLQPLVSTLEAAARALEADLSEQP
ncbi:MULTISPECIES: IclR family transcriptional regulator [Streptomyces]|uniref:IclR family transcriptional regulator n=1 Tax=Streptomyces edwardsiae TaxID=3075527 RepID=A0ABU2QG54_9ACTN|nr:MULTISPECIES: IclR family transcriptional regulator [unclassified Streptomyces]MDT0403448.1 IclR family transcriptional regulator [Streptomyces sp. DSM 41635]